MITIEDNYNLLTHNTFGLQSQAGRWVNYTSPTDLLDIEELCRNQRFFNLGEGSNVLLPPEFDGVVLHSDIKTLSFEPLPDGQVVVTAGSGNVLDNIVELCCRRGWWGMENLSLIPGSVGASVVQNVGAYGVEMAHIVEKVTCFDLSKRRFITVSNKDCEFGYRDSVFKKQNGNLIVSEVTLRLNANGSCKLNYGNIASMFAPYSSPSPMEVRSAIIAVRDSKLPRVGIVGSAGSFFKNPVMTHGEFEELKQKWFASAELPTEEPPYYLTADNLVKVPAAWLIEKCGFKGRSFGNVAVWDKQPLVLVNATGRATREEVLDCAHAIIDSVKRKFSVTLHPEVVIV